MKFRFEKPFAVPRFVNGPFRVAGGLQTLLAQFIQQLSSSLLP